MAEEAAPRAAAITKHDRSRGYLFGTYGFYELQERGVSKPIIGA